MDYVNAAFSFGIVFVLFHFQRRLLVELKVKTIHELSHALRKKDSRFVQVLVVLFYASIQVVLLKFAFEATLLREYESYAAPSAILAALFLLWLGLNLAFRVARPTPLPQWFYFVPYQTDISLALASLREREFRSGRYNPVVPYPQFPISQTSPSPGPQHSSIQDALIASVGVGGTRSILDVNRVSDEPLLGAVAPLSSQDLLKIYATCEPSREMIEKNMNFLHDLDVGQGVYIISYRDGQPSEIFFGGCASG
jgi:hypothetical protein